MSVWYVCILVFAWIFTSVLIRFGWFGRFGFVCGYGFDSFCCLLLSGCLIGFVGLVIVCVWIVCVHW